jgi:hypothetical protein
MTHAAWNRFIKAREHYRDGLEKLNREMPGLRLLQQRLVDNRRPSYTVETPIVYNGAIDDIQQDSDIRLILVADNPGRREQAAENRRYLVGPSGKIAEKFFRDNPALKIDFRKNVIILNKTPVHTPRTIELKELRGLGGAALETAIDESQQFMACLLFEFHNILSYGKDKPVPVWITGYSEMKKTGVFAAYTNELKTIYNKSELVKTLFLYRHFSMNQFTIDLKRQISPGESVAKALKRIGAAYRRKFII